MAKKNFKNSAKESVASAFFGEAIQNISDTMDTQDVSKEDMEKEKPIDPNKYSWDTQDVQDVQKIESMERPPYRINLKLKGEYKDYLDQVSWENRTSITAYLNDLIEEDQKRYLKKK